MVGALTLVAVLSTGAQTTPVDHWEVSERVVREILRLGLDDGRPYARLAQSLHESGNTKLAWLALDQMDAPIPGNLYIWYRMDGDIDQALETIFRYENRLKRPFPAVVERALYRRDVESISAAVRYVRSQQRQGRDAGIGGDVINLSALHLSPMTRLCTLLLHAGLVREGIAVAESELTQEELRGFINWSTANYNLVAVSEGSELSELAVRHPDKFALHWLLDVAQSSNNRDLLYVAADRLLSIAGGAPLYYEYENYSLSLLVNDLILNLYEAGMSSVALRIVDAHWATLRVQLQIEVVKVLADRGHNSLVRTLAQDMEAAARMSVEEAADPDDPFNQVDKWILAVHCYRYGGQDDEAKAIIEEMKGISTETHRYMVDAFRRYEIRDAGPEERLEFASKYDRSEFVHLIESEAEAALRAGDSGLARRLVIQGANELIRQKRPFGSFRLLALMREMNLEDLLVELVTSVFTAEPASLTGNTAYTPGIAYAFIHEDEVALPYLMRAIEDSWTGLIMVTHWQMESQRDLGDLTALNGVDVLGFVIEPILAVDDDDFQPVATMICDMSIAMLMSVQDDEPMIERLLGYFRRSLPDPSETYRDNFESLALGLAISEWNGHLSIALQERVLEIIIETRGPSSSLDRGVTRFLPHATRRLPADLRVDRVVVRDRHAQPLFSASQFRPR